MMKKVHGNVRHMHVRTSSLAPTVQVREIQNEAECHAVAKVVSKALPEMVKGSGLSLESWAWAEGEKLARTKMLWAHYGVAIDLDKIIGLVVIRLRGDRPHEVGCAEACCHAGCYGALRSSCARSFHKDIKLSPKSTDAFIDLVAVDPNFLRQGVGKAMMRWVEQQSLDLLRERFPEEIKTQGSRVVLEVGTTNAPGIALFEHMGYEAIGRSDQDAKGSCCMEPLMECFLGYPRFYIMAKRLSAAYQRAIQSPGNFTGRSEIIHLPADPEEEMNRA